MIRVLVGARPAVECWSVMRQDNQPLPYEPLLGGAVVCITLGTLVSVGTALLPVMVSALRTRRFGDIGYGVGELLIAVGVLLLISWAALFGRRFWQRRRDCARRGFAVLPKGPADSAP